MATANNGNRPPGGGRAVDVPPPTPRHEPAVRRDHFDTPTIAPPAKPPVPKAKDGKRPPPIPQRSKSFATRRSSVQSGVARTDGTQLTEATPLASAVLLVGSKFAMLEGLGKALEARQLAVETATKDELLDKVVVAAPDLIVLLGDAAEDGGLASVRTLARSGLSSVVPVVLLTDDDRLDARVRAFRHGIAACVKTSPSVDAIAAELAELAAEIPTRKGVERGRVGQTTLADLVDLLSNEVRSGILSVTPGGSTGAGGVQVLLGGGRPVSDIIDEFVSQLKTQVVSAEPLEYEFDEWAAGTVQLLSKESSPPPPNPVDLTGVRIVLADDDAARADAVAQALRREGAVVVVIELAPEGVRFERVQVLDPAILLIGDRQLKRGAALIRQMRDDPRLRWVSLLVVRWDEIWKADAAEPSMAQLSNAVASLVESERAILALGKSAPEFDTRLEILGPARLLRALVQAERPLRVTVNSPRASISVDLAEGLVVGASGTTFGKGAVDLAGSPALAGLLVLGSGRVTVQQVEQAQHANLMAPVEIALNQALAEEPPIPPSVAPVTTSLRAVDAALLAQPDSSKPMPPAEPAHADSAPAHAVDEIDVEVAAPSERLEPTPRRSKTGRVLGGLLLVAVVAVAGVAVYYPGLLDRVRGAPVTPKIQEKAAELPVSDPPLAPQPVAAPEPSPADVLRRVENGDPEEIKKLEAKPPASRTPEESIALARGRAAGKRHELDELRRAVKTDAALAKNPETLQKLAAYARDPQTAHEALRTLAEMPSSEGADLLYDLWTGTPEKTPTTELAQELVGSDQVRKKASPALAAVLELRRAQSCEEVKQLLPRVRKEGDQRAVRPLVKLLAKRGCGPQGAQDCHPCLRGSRLLTDVIMVVEKRPPPETAATPPSPLGPVRTEKPAEKKPAKKPYKPKGP